MTSAAYRNYRNYRPIDPARARRIHTLAVPLGLGLLVLGAVLAGVVVYLALTWAPKVPLLAMTAGMHGATALIAMCSGVITISLRKAVSTGWLNLGSANAARRNLAVLWTLSILMALLGWLGVGAGPSLAHVSLGVPVVVASMLVPIVLLLYNGIVTVLVSRLLRT